ncbi:hypothetical protein B0H94_10594 [Salsuginibacillus halophilus]|uniref:CAAX prenyl protease 2/Lysostaphin resistance protein A-like domain-containing protein n=1 Tax=Salsuginibacillus halophilus TaxID=517424 RepID=A0A2P8HL62_9BACI|nr:CPBP family intramembrane glutamic endopeptidase [Salsuginibacillus halophilus]PSL46941.1 hypothetical protein B0H94_10594 [Salsuginibacillus halophilus]
MVRRYWIILITYIAMHLSGFIGMPALVAILGFDLSQAVVWWNIISFIIALIIIGVLLLPERHEQPRIEKAGPGPVTFWIIAGFFLAMFAQATAVFIQSSLLGIEPGSENTEQILQFIESFPIFIMVVVVIGPILEEIVFRKVLFGSLYKRMNFFWAALISSFIFSIVHVDLENLLVYLAVGFVFAYLYVKTNRILVPIIAHVIMNLFAALGPQFADFEEELQFIVHLIGGVLR